MKYKIYYIIKCLAMFDSIPMACHMIGINIQALIIKKKLLFKMKKENTIN